MSSSAPDKLIKLEQSLHGYADGHRLLETSRKLSPEAEKLMQVMSDMSGPSMISGFETYITGYPLQDLGVYALGRTWYAPEMKRPGCVWTHTLLIENSDLAQLQDLRILLDMFRRPSADPASWKTYRHSLNLPGSGNQSETVAQNTILEGIPYDIVAANTLAAMYGEWDKAVYIPTSLPSTYEELIFLIWTQQWPRLRRSFSFSTGSIANRKTSGKPFDLQVISLKSLNQLGREVPSAVILKPSEHQGTLVPTDWVLTATADLTEGSSGPLRKFLQHYGVDTTKGRSAFARLVEMFIRIDELNKGKIALKNLVELLGQNFSEPGEACRLKIALLGRQPIKQSPLSETIPEAEILWELCTTPFYEAFDPAQIDIRSRAKMLLETQRTNAREITLKLFGSNLTPLGEEFLTGISEAIDIEDAYEFARSKPELLNAFTIYNPTLAAMPGLWHSSPDEQRDFFDIVVADPRSTDESISNMIIAMLKARSDVLAEEVITKYRKTAVTTILDLVNSDQISSLNLSLEWQRPLRSDPSELLLWIKKSKKPNESTIAFIISLLDPHSPQVVNFGAKVWLPFTATAHQALHYKTLVKSMSFLLTLGFNNAPSGAAELVARSFEIVHSAAADDDLPKDSWRQLKDLAPDYSSWWSWDKCRRLRRALIDKFIKYHWSTEVFLEAVQKKKTFNQVLDDCNDTSHGREFIRTIAEQVIVEDIDATPYQKNILVRYR